MGIPGSFDDITVLHEGPRSLIRRARLRRDGTRVILKSPRVGHTHSESRARLQREHELLVRLGPPVTVYALGLSDDLDGPVLVLEDTGARVLQAEIPPGGMELHRFLELAPALARHVGELHRARILHGALHPGHILVPAGEGAPALIGFTDAVLLPREHAEVPAPGGAEGSRAWLSPEQTGRTSRGVDWRSDLHALGATFYEMLTGRPPFDAAEPLARVHALIARMPAAPHELRPEVPPVLSAIVLKLLAKPVEDRYQGTVSLAEDLEEAARRLRATGHIEPFALASRDTLRHFPPPRRLYGREAQVEQLHASVGRVAQGGTEAVFFMGESGLGKSLLAREAQAPILEHGGSFAESRFDALHGPQGTLVGALRGLLRRLFTRSEEQVRGAKARLSEALGPQAGLLCRMMPELELILGPREDGPELPAAEGHNALHALFPRFIQALATRDHPIVLFLDDLHQADPSSLKLLQRLLCDARTEHLLLIGTWRVEEVPASAALVELLKLLRASYRPTCFLRLEPLGRSHVRELVAESLGESEAACGALADFVYARTRGNPLFVREFLGFLYDTGLLRPGTGGSRWSWDLEEIRGQEVTDSVARLMAERVQRLPEASRRALELAACIGGAFDMRTLALVSEQPVERALQPLLPALKAGLLVPVSSAPGPEEAWRYGFPHDRVRQAAYEQLPEDARRAVHLKVGRLLLEKLDAKERDARLFEIAGHLAQGAGLVQEPREREQLARLVLEAGRRARASGAFQSAAAWLRLGRKLLPEDAWAHQYVLALALYSEGAETAFLCTDFVEMAALSKQVMVHARSVVDQVPVHELRILYLHTVLNRTAEALELAREVLRGLGVPLPARPSPVRVLTGMLSTMWAMWGWTADGLSTLPPMTDPARLAAMRVLSRAASCAYISSPNTYVLVALWMVRLSLRHGHCAVSPLGYFSYALLLYILLGRFGKACELARFAVGLQERFQAPALQARMLVSYHVTLGHLMHPLRESGEGLRTAIHTGEQTGDTEFSNHAAVTYAECLVWTGEPLEAVQRRQAEVLSTIRRSRSGFHLLALGVSLQFVAALRGESADPLRLSGPGFDEDVEIPRLTQARSHSLLAEVWNFKAALAWLHGDAEAALAHAEQARPHNRALTGTFQVLESTFYESLILLSRHARLTVAQRFVLWRHRRKLRTWARQCAVNCESKHLLVEAEHARVEGRVRDALALYERAAASALEAGFRHEAAVAMELAGRFHLAQGLWRSGWSLLHEAWQAYGTWGARHKAALLEAELRAAPAGLLPAACTQALAAPARPQVPLDLMSLFSASRTLSEELVLGALLRRLVRLLIENAGAERGVLLLENEGTLRIEAEGHAGEAEGASAPALRGTERLSPAILNYVVRTGESVVLHDATADATFANDEYIARERPRSVLCAPLVNQGRRVAIIYLENNLATGSFTEDRLEVLRLLLSQAVLSIHNARLYARLEESRRQMEDYSRTLEEKVDARTRELRAKNDALERTLGQLRETQEQLVHQERQAYLGTLAAGISHELKNPLNFVNNFAELSVSLTDELSAAVREGDAREDVEEALGTLRGNLSRIREHGERADRIIGRMLQHARGSGSREVVELNGLVADSVKLARDSYRFQGSPFEVALETSYDGAIGLVELVPQDFSRVIINLVSNALDALAERKQAEPGHTPRLTVRTRAVGDRCEVCITDNGTGISEEHAGKIFHPFFTTRPAGQGAGLGLSTSYDIIVRGHLGELRMDTVPGRSAAFTISLPRRSGFARLRSVA